MDEQLIKFIELCLADGVITDKEREVIFRKAKKLGVDEDECEILIDSFTQRINKVSPNEKQTPSKNKRNFTPKKIQDINPAILDQEKVLLKKISEKNSNLNLLNGEYNALVEDLKAVKNKLDSLKQLNEADFNSYIKKYEKDISSHISAYIRDINNKVSSQYGNISMVINQKDKDKLILLDPPTRKKYIELNITWDLSQINQERKAMSLLYFFGWFLICSAPVLYFWESLAGFFTSIVLSSVALIVGVIVYMSKQNLREQVNVLRKDQLAQILDNINNINKELDDDLLERKEMINKVRTMQNTLIKIPSQNKLIN